MKKKYPNKLIEQAHHLAFETKTSNKAIARKLNLEADQLDYVLYTLKPKEKPKPKEPTITESFLDFFIADKFR